MSKAKTKNLTVLLVDDDPTILKHLGDVCFKLNDFLNARKYWERARQMGADAEAIRQRLEQLENLGTQ